MIFAGNTLASNMFSQPANAVLHMKIASNIMST